MGLDHRRVLGLGQNLEEIFVGKEEEPGEHEPLLLQVVAQTFLDFIEIVIRLFELSLDVFLFGEVLNGALFLDAFHGVSPESINRDEHLVLLGHRGSDIS